MCPFHFLGHNQCLLARGMASEYFDGQRIATDQRKLYLREVLHTLFCALAQIQSFGCLIRWRFLRQPTTIISASVSTLRVEEVPIDMVSLPLVVKYYRDFSPCHSYGFRVARKLNSTTSLRALAACLFSTLSVADATATPTRSTRTIPRNAPECYQS